MNADDDDYDAPGSYAQLPDQGDSVVDNDDDDSDSDDNAACDDDEDGTVGIEPWLQNPPQIDADCDNDNDDDGNGDDVCSLPGP